MCGSLKLSEMCFCVSVYLSSYLLEHAGCYERTPGVESPRPTNIQVSLVDVLQNSQEVSTFKLERDTEEMKDRNIKLLEKYNRDLVQQKMVLGLFLNHLLQANHVWYIWAQLTK